MIVVFLHGPVASGKHTIGSLLAARTGLPLFHNHLAVDAALALFPFGSPGFIELRTKTWRAAFEAAAAARRSFIFTFHPEASVDPRLVPELCATIESVGGRVQFVELRCARATILERLGNSSRAQFGKLTDRRLYEEIERRGGFRFPPLPEPLLRIDSDQLSAEEAAGRIAGALVYDAGECRCSSGISPSR